MTAPTNEREQARWQLALDWSGRYQFEVTDAEIDDKAAFINRGTPQAMRQDAQAFCAGHRSRDQEVDELRAENKRLRNAAAELSNACAKVQDWEGTRVGNAQDAIERLLAQEPEP